MKGKDKLSQAHLDALPILLDPLIKASHSFVAITGREATQILREWDEARSPKPLKDPHEPASTNSSRHVCNLAGYPQEGYGEAVTYCAEREDGTLWAGNSEYGSQVNFCPACGFQAKVHRVDG